MITGQVSDRRSFSKYIYLLSWRRKCAENSAPRFICQIHSLSWSLSIIQPQLYATNDAVTTQSLWMSLSRTQLIYLNTNSCGQTSGTDHKSWGSALSLTVVVTVTLCMYEYIYIYIYIYGHTWYVYIHTYYIWMYIYIYIYIYILHIHHQTAMPSHLIDCNT